MNHISFAVGDRVRHKITQIQAEIVQLEESLAMPHVWVIEPSQCEVNTPKLYQIIDLEKVESGDNQELEVDTSTSKQFPPPDKSIDSGTISLSDRKPRLDTLTSKEIPEESVLTVENEATTVSTKLESQDLTVSHQTINQTASVSTELESSVLTVESQNLTISHKAITVSTKIESHDLTVSHKATLQSESVRSEQILSKLLPITVRSSSNTTDITSTSNELVTKQDLTVEHNSTTVSTINQLQDLTVENQTTTVSTKDQFSVLTVENHTTTVSTNQICNKRRKGEGTGRIQLRTITKQNGKQYQQFWYDWQIHTSEKTIYKSVYIPKRLLKKIQALESAKAPVREILEVLGVIGK